MALLALVVALAVSMTSRINVGWIALALAWLVGVHAAGLRVDEVLSGFPVGLFVTLAGVTLLFAITETNGTLSLVATRLIVLARGDPRVVPVVFFLLACAIASVGPGAISTVALLAPLAMSVGHRVGISPFLTALMVANGANAGNLSPFSSVGIIANGAMARAGLAGNEGRVWFANFAAHATVTCVAYGWALRRSARSPRRAAADTLPAGDAPHPSAAPTFSTSQRASLAAVAVWISGVLFLGWHLGLAAFAASALLLVLNAGDETAAIKRIPWDVIMMVCGVSVLIAMLERTGGMDLFTRLLATAASPSTINGMIAFVTGAVSTYSSTSGVVLPAFLPTVPGLVQQVGGGDALAVALSINVGSSLVDVSPLSTLGALCVAAAPDPTASRSLFRALLAWGLSMVLVGAVLCQLFAGALAVR